MASIVFRKTKNETNLDKQRQKGMVDAGHDIAALIDTEAAKTNPVFDKTFAERVVQTALATYVDHPDYKVDYMGFPLSRTTDADVFAYNNPATSGIDLVKIFPVADDRVKKMNIAVPIPATPGLSVLEGYGQEVLDDLQALTSASPGVIADAQKYFLATVMFRRCR